MTSIIQKKPPAPKPVNKADPKPLVKPPVMLPPKPPIVRPGPIRADDTGFVPPSERNVATRGGTPVTVKDAPGYRGSGTQPMPSSQPRGFSKGGSASKRADGIAIRGKTRA